MNNGESDWGDSNPGQIVGLPRRPYPSNPIGVIALFVFFIEAIATVSLKFLLDASSPYTVYIIAFIVAFPLLLLLLFFGTLWLRRESLYSPSDFREDANFMHLIAKVDERFEKVEMRQKAALLDPRGDPSDVFALIPDLLAKEDVETVLSLGGAFLKVRRYSSSLRVLKLLSALPLARGVRLKVMAFTAYSLNGLGRHKEALDELTELRRLDPEEAEKFWLALAFAYSHFKLGDQWEFEAWSEKIAAQRNVAEYFESAAQLYPDFQPYLRARIGLTPESAP